MKTFTLMVWLLLPGQKSIVLENTPMASEADCINGVVESMSKIEEFAKEHKLDDYAFDVTCRAGDYHREGEPEERKG
jgi:hypothetical protein